MLVDEVAVGVPVGVGGAGEEVDDVAPLAPGVWGCGDEAGSGSAGDGDGDLFAVLGAADEVGGVLA